MSVPKTSSEPAVLTVEIVAVFSVGSAVPQSVVFGPAVATQTAPNHACVFAKTEAATPYPPLIGGIEHALFIAASLVAAVSIYFSRRQAKAAALLN